MSSIRYKSKSNQAILRLLSYVGFATEEQLFTGAGADRLTLNEMASRNLVDIRLLPEGTRVYRLNSTKAVKRLAVFNSWPSEQRLRRILAATQLYLWWTKARGKAPIYRLMPCPGIDAELIDRQHAYRWLIVDATQGLSMQDRKKAVLSIEQECKQPANSRVGTILITSKKVDISDFASEIRKTCKSTVGADIHEMKNGGRAFKPL